MEGATALLYKSIAREEYESIQEPLREKIESVLNGHIQDYLTAKACFESTKITQDARIHDLDEQLKLTKQERDDFKIKVEALSSQHEETVKRLNAANIHLNKLRDDVQRLEKTLETVRKERDDAVDEKQVTSNALERREIEVERLRTEVSALNADLRSAVAARCEAVSLSEDVQAKQLQLEFKEKKFESERTLLKQQILELTSDVTRINDEFIKFRRESTSDSVTYKTKIAEKEEELNIAQEQIKKHQTINKEMTEKIEKLNEKIKNMIEKHDIVTLNCDSEVKAQSKLAELYKERLEETEKRCSDLTGAVKDLQRLLKEASDQHGILETKLAQFEQDSKATLSKKQEAINALKEELRHANILLEAVKQESSEAAVSRLSPLAASASKLLKSGLTLTQLYTKYAEVTQEMLVLKMENKELTATMNQMIDEIKEKSGVFQKEHDDYVYAVESLDQLSSKLQDLEAQHSVLLREKSEADSTSAYLMRENKKKTETINDLGRQVCFLLREVEAARGNHIPIHGIQNAEAITSSDVISKHLVTFKDIQDLELTNQKLLAALREISTEKDQIEINNESETVLDLRGQVERSQLKINDLQEREKFLEKELQVIKTQRDVYERLSKQSKTENQPQPVKIHGETDEIKILKNLIEEMKKDHEIYRKERNTNEKMLNETNQLLMAELKESTRTISEITTRSEYMSEKCKSLAKQVETQANELNSLEKRCNNNNVAMGKLESSLQHTRNEAMDALSKLSIAESTLSKIKQENEHIKNSERRLQSEIDIIKREKHGQELLMANLEAIKTNFEGAELANKMRLEKRLDDANTECIALRRRLQEEQDRLTRRIELLEQQTKTAKERLEEEKTLKESIKEQLEEARLAVTQMEERLEEMSNQLTSAINKSQPVLERENKIKDLESQLRLKDAAIEGLKEQVAMAKQCQQELSEVYQGIEKQLTEVTEQADQYKEEAEKKIEELTAANAELKSIVSNLEIKLQTSNAAEIENRVQREAEVVCLRNKVEILAKDLENTKMNLTTVEKEGQEAAKKASEAQEKASSQVVVNDQLQSEITQLRSELSGVKGELEIVTNEKERILKSNVTEKESLEIKINHLESNLQSSNNKIVELTKVNELLQDQLQELGLKVSVLDNSGIDLESSLTDTSFRESDKLLEVMRFLRNEKSAAIAQAEALKSEKLEKEQQLEVLKRKLEESNKMLENERNSNTSPSIAAERHTQLLSKVETLNQLTENNISLRKERDELMAKLSSVENELKTLDENIVNPIKKKSIDLEGKVEQLMTEMTALKAENQRWKERTNQLIERSKNPNELKRLTQEKENLTKQLGIERDQAKIVKQKSDELIAQLKKEKDDSVTTLVSLEKLFNAARADLTSAREAETKANEKALKLEQDIAQQEANFTEVRNKEMQIRQIAKKYKIQYQELAKMLEEKNKDPVETDDKLKTLMEQSAAIESENETLKQENEALKASVLEREERAKTLLKNARSRVFHLQEENKSLIKEVSESRSKRGEGSNDIYETRISQLEKEKEEEIAEKERLSRELEIMTQRLTLIQRQMEKTQGTKPSTSTEKSPDPPTANIKPMAGPSQVAKQVQPQPVTVTPWRETPFASIRPMSQQARTVVVLPTSQTSNLPVLVAPQQVHTSSEGLSSSPTSSHVDCMPATSSAVHSLQAPHTVIQHMEEVCDEIPAPTHHVPNPNVSIALVLPQPTPQQDQEENSENSGVVSASNEEHVSEQSVSASNTSGVGPTYYRNVDESGSVASSQEGPSLSAGSSTIAASSQQAASSTTSVTTSVAPAKRPIQEDDCKHLPPNKRRMLTTEGEMLLRSDGLEVEYQVPTSSQQQEDDVLVISDEDDIDDSAMEDGQEFEEEPEEESRYAIEAYGQDGQDMANYEENDGPDIDEGTTEDNNEVDIDSNEVPNQSEGPEGSAAMEGVATTGGEATSSLGSTTNQYQVRRPPSVPVRHHMILTYEDPGDDSIVPSTPTLFVPRRTDGYGEAVSSPHVPTTRFTFTDSGTRPPVAGVAQVASEGMDDTRMDLSQLDEGTGRSVPTTPSHVSPQEPNPCGQSSVQDITPENVESIPDPAVEQENNDDNGVSSETEKPILNPPATSDPEEGREAEASPTARSSNSQNQINTRSSTSQPPRRGRVTRSNTARTNAPTPIVWETEPSISMTPLNRDFFFGNPNRSQNRNLMGRGVGSSGVGDMRVAGGRGMRRGRGVNQPFHTFHGNPRGGNPFQNQPR